MKSRSPVRQLRHERAFPGDRVVGYGVIIVASALTVLPLLYMFSLSLQSDADIFAGQVVLWPESPQFSNFVTLFRDVPFARFLVNSFIMSAGITIAHLAIDALTGYVFAKFDFWFRRTLFVIILTTLMIPFFVRLIPLYVMFSQLGWLNTYQGLIVPFLTSAFGIFLMRQFFLPLPDDLIEAARMDGASEFRIFLRIMLPQVKPALAVLGLFTFVFHWNEFLWPLLATSSTNMRTAPVGLTLFNQEYFTQWNLTGAGAVVLFIPTAILFIATQRYIVQGIALTGIK